MGKSRFGNLAARLSATALFCVLGAARQASSATYTVTHTGYAGFNSLDHAMSLAKDNPGPDVIDATGISGVISLRSSLNEVSEELTILGPGASLLTVEGYQTYGIFVVTGSAADLTISGLTVKGGRRLSGGAICCWNGGVVSLNDCTFRNNGNTNINAKGGAIYCATGVLNASNCTFSDNDVSYLGSSTTNTRGGAIYLNSGQANLVGCTISRSSASSGGAIYNDGGVLRSTDCSFDLSDAKLTGGAISNLNGVLELTRTSFASNSLLDSSTFAAGGAIWSDGASSTITLTDCTFLQNRTQWLARGGAIRSRLGSILAAGCLFDRNFAANGGGAVYHEDGALEIRGSTFIGNYSLGSGGAINIQDGSAVVSDCTFRTNGASATEGSGGGAINLSSASLTASGCLFELNKATSGYYTGAAGGAILSYGNLNVADCVFRSNRVVNSDQSISGAGGAISTSGSSSIWRCEISDNDAAVGGGIVAGGTTRLVATTISSNRAVVYGGGIYVTSRAELSNCTVWGNSAPSGAAVFSWTAGDCYKGSVLGGSLGGGNRAGYYSPQIAGINYSDDGTLPGSFQVTAAQLNLGPLADNGGPTRTHALLYPSCAMDTALDGTDWHGNALSTDQRGTDRPFGPGFDVGAFESEDVRQFNRPPIAVGDSYEVHEDTVLSRSGAGILANDCDLDNDVLTASLVSGPSHGTLVLNADGTFSYVPELNYHGPDTFVYRVSDGRGGEAEASVALTVIPVNDDPEASSDNGASELNDSVLISVIQNDYDVDGDVLVVVAVTHPENGMASINAGNTVTYTPRNGFLGSDSFTYTVSDGQGGFATATIILTVSLPNRSPVAVADSAHCDRNSSVTINVLANDRDPDGDPLSLTFVGLPDHGTVANLSNGTVTYTPAPGFRGRDSFEYMVSDGRGGTSVGRVNVVVH